MEAGGLRARKKARTRGQIAETAARLFGERGYENVAIIDVARAAEVSEQTVYNYFPTKQDLVLDRDDEVRERFARAVRERAPGTSPAAALRQEAIALVESVRPLSSRHLRGSVGHLAAVSPTIHRLTLESTEHLAVAVADAILDSTPGVDPHVVRVQAVALAWVSQTVIDESGRLTREGRDAAAIADAVRPMVEAIIDSVDRWFRAV